MNKTELAQCLLLYGVLKKYPLFKKREVMQLLNYEVWIASSDTCKTGVFIHFARSLLTGVTVGNGVGREDSCIKWHK